MSPVYLTNLVVSSALAGIAICFVVARFVSYPRALRETWTKVDVIGNTIERWQMVGAALAFVFYCSSIWAAVAFTRSDSGDEKRSWYREMRRMDYSFGITGYATSFMLCRTAMHMFFQRIWRPVMQGTKKMNWLNVAFIILNLAWLIMTILSKIRKCPSDSRAWGDEYDGSCVDHRVILTIVESWSFVLNAWLLVTAIVMTWPERCKRDRNLEMMVPFSLGSFICITSLVQIGMTWQNRDVLDKYNGYLLDRSLQLGIAIVCCCVVPIRSLLPSKPDSAV